ncbi:MAG: yecA family protein [Lentisphaeria bacterium]|jgi:yecA family protein
MSKDIDYHFLNDQFLNMGAIASVSELQGLLCGKLSGGQSLDDREWQDIAIEFMELEHLRLNEDQTFHIQALYKETRRLLRDANFRFSPMLPGDESSIDRRVQELGAWCQGFLHGVGTSGLSGNAVIDPNVADALRDLAQISQVSVEEDDDVDENEVYWVELVEFVKVAVLSIYVDLGDSDDASAKQQSKTNKTVH